MSDCEHMRCEEHCVNEINGAGVHREYWLECLDCGETFDEHPHADCEGCGDPDCPCHATVEPGPRGERETMNASEANEINLPEHWWAFCTKHNVEYLYYRDLKNGCTYCDKAPAPKPVEPAQVESAPVELYYVQDTRQYCGNSCFWWKPNGNGYTCNLDEAWKVPKEKAESMMRHRPGVDVAWPVASIDSGTARHFDMQNLREMKSL